MTLASYFISYTFLICFVELIPFCTFLGVILKLRLSYALKATLYILGTCLDITGVDDIKYMKLLKYMGHLAVRGSNKTVIG